MSLRRVRNLEATADEENPYWLSFSDIMSGLLIIFVLASLVLVLELSQRKTVVDEKILERTKAEKIRHEVLIEIMEELRQREYSLKLAIMILCYVFQMINWHLRPTNIEFPQSNNISVQ